MDKNLKGIGKNETWLHQQLKAQNVKDIKEVFLATCDSNQKVCIYKKINSGHQHNVLQ